MMWKLAVFTVGLAAGAVSAVVYQAKIRDSAWLQRMTARVQNRFNGVTDEPKIVVEK